MNCFDNGRIQIVCIIFLAIGACGDSGGGDSANDAGRIDSQTASVPDLVGLSQAAAESDTVSAGYTVGSISYQPDPSIAAGIVLDHDPTAGTALPLGDAIDLVISLGSAEGEFSDEFGGKTLDEWTRRHVVEGTAAQYTTLDINSTRDGHLTIVPTQTPGWFAGGVAPLLFKLVTGNFSVRTYVTTRSPGTPQAPNSNFNSAGLMARNPSIANGQNYIMLNVGFQDGGTGTEVKTTVASSSTLFITAGGHSAELLLCRVGDTFHSFRRVDTNDQWTEQEMFTRSDLPDTLQVGLIANGFSGPDLQAEFDYVRWVGVPSLASECLP